jgi:hypothetical protein
MLEVSLVGKLGRLSCKTSAQQVSTGLAPEILSLGPGGATVFHGEELIWTAMALSRWMRLPANL